MTAAVRVPGPRVPPETMLPHVLVVVQEGDERDARIEHPPGCPRVCHWWPDAGSEAAELLSVAFPEWDYACYVAWETSSCGLAAIEGDVDGVYVGGVDGWRSLRPGRYLLQPWFESGYSHEYGCFESEGGISLVGRERPRPWDRLRWSRLRADARYLWRLLRRGYGVNLPGSRLALRGPADRAYFSERDRKGCAVLPLAGGWRLVLTRRRGLR